VELREYCGDFEGALDDRGGSEKEVLRQFERLGLDQTVGYTLDALDAPTVRDPCEVEVATDGELRAAICDGLAESTRFQRHVATGGRRRP
jgi:hypothetical protein